MQSLLIVEKAIGDGYKNVSFTYMKIWWPLHCLVKNGF